MSDTTINVKATQVNAKRHWPKAVKRVLRMLANAEENGATIVTFNEVTREQVLAIKKLPGWDISWQINDHIRGGSWAGNAVAWRVSHWASLEEFGQPVEIDYRKGLRSAARLGRWQKKTIKFACVTLISRRRPDFELGVQSFHYPTRFNSNAKSRNTCAVKSGSYAARLIENGRDVILGGDGNGLTPRAKKLRLMDRDGPDLIASTGRKIRSRVLQFKKFWLSDHNGMLVVIQFDLS